MSASIAPKETDGVQEIIANAGLVFEVPTATARSAPPTLIVRLAQIRSGTCRRDFPGNQDDTVVEGDGYRRCNERCGGSGRLGGCRLGCRLLLRRRHDGRRVITDCPGLFISPSKLFQQLAFIV